MKQFLTILKTRRLKLNLQPQTGRRQKTAPFLTAPVCGCKFSLSRRVLEDGQELLHGGRKHFVLLVNRRERAEKFAVSISTAASVCLLTSWRDGAERHDGDARVNFHGPLHGFDVVEFHDVFYFDTVFAEDLSSALRVGMSGSKPITF